MLKKISNLSLRWKFMLAPVLGVLFSLVLAFLFISTTTEQRTTLSNIQKITMDNSRSLTHLASRLATNHARVYELLKYASEDGDEASLYVMGKPLLNEVHKLEAATLVHTQKIDSAEPVLDTIARYRKQIITAVEMSTVDLSLAYKYMTLATIEFNKANAAFLKLNEDMQNDLRHQLTDFHHSAEKTLQQYSALFIFSILIVIIISYFLSKLLSQDLQESINTLSKLTTNENLIKNSSEVLQLTQVIHHVKQSHFNLEKIQNELSLHGKQLRSILDNMADGVITMNEDGIILTFNNAAEKIFGYSENELMGKNINAIISKHDAKHHDGYLQHYLKTGETHIIGVEREVKAQRRNGEDFPIHLSVTELPIETDGKRCFVGSCRDITLSKQQEQQLRRSQKMDALGKLTGGIAHDYNNMLGVILGYSDILASTLTGQTENTEHVEKIIHAAERGVKLTSKLMSFSQLKHNNAEKLDLNKSLKSQQHMLEKTLTVRIKFILDLSPDIWPIKVDYGDLEDAILNICINAMHAMEQGGQLTIQTQKFTVEKDNFDFINLQPGDYTLLNIIDTGQGMSEETLSKIFDPFYSTKGEQGTGLGLSQVYGFVERSKGAIKAYSELGHGTRFSLYFPRLLENIEPPQVEKSEEKIDLNGHETILVVDDEPELLNLCAHLLQQNGYQVFKAQDATEALSILEQEPVDLVISDVIMPDIDGFKLAVLIQEKYPNIKIQLTSGFSDNRHLNTGDKELNKHLIHKPYNPQVLLTRLRELLSN